MSTTDPYIAKARQAPEEPKEQALVVVLRTPVEDDPEHYEGLVETIARLVRKEHR